MPKIFSLKNIFWVRPYNLSYTHQDPHRNFEGSFDFHLYPAIKRYLVLLYSWVLCCLDLQGLWFRSGLGPKIFLNSIQVDWHLLFWLYSSILLIWYFLAVGVGKSDFKENPKSDLDLDLRFVNSKMQAEVEQVHTQIISLFSSIKISEGCPSSI